MIFNEIYGTYYKAISEILKEALNNPVTEKDIRRISNRYAFDESSTEIEASIKEERWQLLHNGQAAIEKDPSIPLTYLEKSWLKAISEDPRVKLFGDISFDFQDIPPLYRQEDIVFFDRYIDGDPYEDELYIKNFRTVRKAILEKKPLLITYMNKKGTAQHYQMLPLTLEYSEKDDKFRVYGICEGLSPILNMARIKECKIIESKKKLCSKPANMRKSVYIELTDERNALDRVMLHFAHFEKEAVDKGNGKYILKIYYDKADETEMVIRILSFGPLIKVSKPLHFINLVRDRLMKQSKLL